MDSQNLVFSSASLIDAIQNKPAIWNLKMNDGVELHSQSISTPNG